MIGAGVMSKDEKLRSASFCGAGNVGIFSVPVIVDVVCSFSGSERVEDTERRFVRAGVRTVCTGGAAERPEELVRWRWRLSGISRAMSSSSSWLSSVTVSGC